MSWSKRRRVKGPKKPKTYVLTMSAQGVTTTELAPGQSIHDLECELCKAEGHAKIPWRSLPPYVRIRNGPAGAEYAETDEPPDRQLPGERYGTWIDPEGRLLKVDFEGRTLQMLDLPASPQPEDWLYCIACKRFCQMRDTRDTPHGFDRACPFCPALGLDVALFAWDWWAEPGWPERRDLRLGLEHAPGVPS